MRRSCCDTLEEHGIDSHLDNCEHFPPKRYTQADLARAVEAERERAGYLAQLADEGARLLRSLSPETEPQELAMLIAAAAVRAEREALIAIIERDVSNSHVAGHLIDSIRARGGKT